MAQSSIEKQCYLFSDTITVNEGYAIVNNPAVTTSSKVIAQIQRSTDTFWEGYVRPWVIENGKITFFVRTSNWAAPSNGTKVKIHYMVGGGNFRNTLVNRKVDRWAA